MLYSLVEAWTTHVSRWTEQSRCMIACSSFLRYGIKSDIFLRDSPGENSLDANDTLSRVIYPELYAKKRRIRWRCRSVPSIDIGFPTIKHLCFSSSISRKVFRWRVSSHWVRSFHYRRRPIVWIWIWPRLSPVALWCRTVPTRVSNLPLWRDRRHFYPTYGKLVQDYWRHSINHQRRNSMVIDRQLLSQTTWCSRNAIVLVWCLADWYLQTKQKKIMCCHEQK